MCHTTSRWPTVLLVLLAALGEAAQAAAISSPPALTGTTTPPLVVLWDTAHTGSNPTSASHAMLRGDQSATTFVLKTSGEVTTADLATVNVYVLVEPDSRDLSASESVAIQGFLARGGNFLLLTDTDAYGAGVNAVLAGSGISQVGITGGGIESTTDLTSHPVTAGVRSFFVASGGCALTATSPAVSCVRYAGATVVAAADLGSHRIVAIGDETSLQDTGLPTPNYRMDDNAVLARNIFNWFRRGGSRGLLSLDASVYSTSAVVQIELSDQDLGLATTASVTAHSNRGDSETVTLSAGGAGRFVGGIRLTAEPVVISDGRLSVADGSSVTIVYHDVNNGSGLPADVTTSATVHGRPPAIRQVRLARVGPFSARISWLTDEPATARVRFWPIPPRATTQTVSRSDWRTSHVLELRWLDPQTTYGFVVEAGDHLGNLAADRGGPTPYRLITGPTRRATPLIRVLLLYSDTAPAGVLDIASKLMADGRIARVDPWDYHAALPDMSTLQSYDAVLVHANLSSPNRSAMGDLLADAIVTTLPAVTLNRATCDPEAIGGRFRAGGYGLFVVSSSYRTNQLATLGAVYATTHPLFDDVARFDGGAWSGHQSAVLLTTGSARTADWSDGEPLIARRVVGGTRLAALNFFGPSSDVSAELWDSSGDGARLMANALVWASRALDSDLWTTPSLDAEPAFTCGTTNTISWLPFAQTTQVEIEWSRDGFATIAGRSGWVAESRRRWTASGLADGQTYAYRMWGRSVTLGYSPYARSVASRQDASPPQTGIVPLPALTTATILTLRLSGSDAVSGLASADLYFRRGSSGTFQSLARLNAPLQATYSFNSAQHGGLGRYEFQIRGTDQVGNVEAKSAADTWTQVTRPSAATPRWRFY